MRSVSRWRNCPPNRRVPPIPLSLIHIFPEEAQGLEYDCSDDGEQLCYVDDTGLWLLRTEDTEPILLAAHPTQPEGEPEIRLARPRFIQQGSSILTAEIQDGSTLYYTRYDLDELERCV